MKVKCVDDRPRRVCLYSSTLVDETIVYGVICAVWTSWCRDVFVIVACGLRALASCVGRALQLFAPLLCSLVPVLVEMCRISIKVKQNWPFFSQGKFIIKPSDEWVGTRTTVLRWLCWCSSQRRDARHSSAPPRARPALFYVDYI